MTQLLTKIIADFSTTLTTKTAVGATTATLTSGLDGDAIQLPTGTYGFTIDRGNSNKEYFTATLTGANLTAIKNVTRGTGVGTSGLVRTHRKGAEVIISDWVAMKRMLDILDGTTSLDASTPLGYDGTASISTDNQLATKAYVDGVAIAGGADSSTTVKGIGKVSVAPVSATAPIFVGDNDPRVPSADPTTLFTPINQGVTTGMISPYAGATAPTSWLLCDGSAVSRATYSALFVIISTTYGAGDGSTTFNLPDIRGRVPVGKSADTEFDVLGETGGAKTHALTSGELASHTHTVGLVAGSPVGAEVGIFSTSHSTVANINNGTETTSSVGSGTAHNNLQPYITINYIIKY